MRRFNSFCVSEGLAGGAIKYILVTAVWMKRIKQGIIYGKNIKGANAHNRSKNSCFTHSAPGNQDHISNSHLFHVWTGTCASLRIPDAIFNYFPIVINF